MTRNYPKPYGELQRTGRFHQGGFSVDSLYVCLYVCPSILGSCAKTRSRIETGFSLAGSHIRGTDFGGSLDSARATCHVQRAICRTIANLGCQRLQLKQCNTGRPNLVCGWTPYRRGAFGG